MQDQPTNEFESDSNQTPSQWSPPAPPTVTSADSDDKSSFGIKPNIISGVSYLSIIVPCFAGIFLNIFILILEKKSKLVRFHALQAMCLQFTGIIVYVISQFLVFALMYAPYDLVSPDSNNFIFIFDLLPFLPIALFLLVVFVCTVMAFMGKPFKLPIIGRMIATNSDR